MKPILDILNESFLTNPSYDLRGISKYSETDTDDEFYSIDLLTRSVRMRQKIHSDEKSGFDDLFKYIRTNFYDNETNKQQLIKIVAKSNGNSLMLADYVCDDLNRNIAKFETKLNLISEDDNVFVPSLVKARFAKKYLSKSNCLVDTGRSSTIALEFCVYDIQNFDIVVSIETNKSDSPGKFESISKSLAYNMTN